MKLLLTLDDIIDIILVNFYKITFDIIIKIFLR